jgi:hypothetical protein
VVINVVFLQRLKILYGFEVVFKRDKVIPWEITGIPNSMIVKIFNGIMLVSFLII